MNSRSIESRVIALDAAVKAIFATHPNPRALEVAFARTYPEKMRELNKSGVPENTAIAKELMAECDALAHHIPKT